MTEAERCARQALAIREQHGDRVGAAGTRHQLADVANSAGRPIDAEAWYKQALSTPNLPAPSELRLYNNLANLLLREIQTGRFPESRLTEARRYAERALEIAEPLDASSVRIWTILNNLAGIADRQGRAKASRAYRRRERETFAALEGNRHLIDKFYGHLIRQIAAAAQGDEQARAEVEANLPKIKAQGRQIADATRRIWVGERDWHALVEELDLRDALLILMVLETIEEMKQARQE